MNYQPQTINQNTFRTPTLNRVQTKAGRMYVLPNGERVPGVTTVLDTAIAKPALVHWAANEERKLCLEIAEQTFKALTGEDGAAVFMTPENFRALMTESLGKSKAHYRAMKKAQNIGTEAHAAIEWHLRQMLGQSVGLRPIISEKAELAVMAVEDWMKSVDFEAIAVEVMVYDPWNGYGGTLDWIARVNGVLTLGDWKTGSAIYRESALPQNAAYIAALRKQCRLGDIPIQGCIIRLPKELEQVEEKPFEEKFITEQETRENFSAFLSALSLFRWVHQIPAPPRNAPWKAAAPRTSALPAVKRWTPKPFIPKPAPHLPVRSTP